MAGTFSGQAQLNGLFRPDTGSIVNDMVSAGAAIARAKLAQDTSQVYIVPFTSMRVHDAIQTVLPSPSANDDLGYPATQTLGTVAPLLETWDLKTTTTTCYARFSFALPPEYDDGQTVECRIRCGMKTTIADTTAKIDLEVYEADRDGGAGADICATAEQDMNNLTNADKTFTITATDLVAGDVLDCRIAVAVVDAAEATAVIGEVLEVAFLLDIRG